MGLVGRKGRCVFGSVVASASVREDACVFEPTYAVCMRM